MAIKKSLYHYTKIDRFFFENLINGTLWFSSPMEINDPYDCQPPLIYGQKSSAYLIAQFYDAMKKQKLDDVLLGTTKEEFISEWNKDAVGWEKRIQAGIQVHINKEFGLFCLTKRPDSIRMWSHYADKHKGVVLEINFHEFLLNEHYEVNGEQINPPYYKVNYPKKGTFLDFLKEGESMTDSLYGQLLTKSQEWKHEKEYRVIVGNAGLHSINKKALTKIIFGLKTPIQEQITIIKLMKSLDYPNLSLGFASPVEEDFKLRIKTYKKDVFEKKSP